MAIEKGDKAPDFTLKSTDGTEFHLYDAIKNGPVLLNFYVGDFGINCTNYMTKFAEKFDQMKDAGVFFIGINNDNLDQHKLFKVRMGLPWDLLFDENQTIVKQYGSIVGPGHMVTGYTNREFFLIGQDGTVLYTWKADVPPTLPKFDELLADVKAALQ